MKFSQKIIKHITFKRLSILFGIAIIVLIFFESRNSGDLYIFLEASKDLVDGENIYDNLYLDWYHYYYDVLFALIIYPLSYIPIYWATFIWLSLNLYFTFRIWKIISSFLELERLPSLLQRIILLTSLITIYGLWYKNIHLSQMTIFILYLSLEGIYRVQQGKLIVGSLFIGIGISIKILPILIIPYFIYRSNFKAAFYSIFSTFLILLLPALLVGYDHQIYLLQERWNLINPFNSAHILDVEEESFHSITTLLSTLLVDDVGNICALEFKRNIANISYDKLKIIISIARLIFLIGILYFIRATPFKKAKSNIQIFYELSYILLITPLIFPHQQHYAFFFIFPAITYLSFYFSIKFFNHQITGRFKKSSLIILLLFIYLFLNSHFILGDLRPIFDHYKTLTYGIIAIIPLLAMSRPIKLDTKLYKQEYLQ